MIDPPLLPYSQLATKLTKLLPLPIPHTRAILTELKSYGIYNMYYTYYTSNKSRLKTLSAATANNPTQDVNISVGIVVTFTASSLTPKSHDIE